MKKKDFLILNAKPLCPNYLTCKDVNDVYTFQKCEKKTKEKDPGYVCGLDALRNCVFEN